MVLVVGAGASKEVNLPTGDQLKDVICHLLNFQVNAFGSALEGGDDGIREALRLHVKSEDAEGHDINYFLGATRRIRSGLPQAFSIDNFIDNNQEHSGIAVCGKLAIVRAILAAEKSSKLYVDPSNIYNTIKFTNIEDCWLTKFFRILIADCRGVKDVAERL
jgi:hypothetical protein